MTEKYPAQSVRLSNTALTFWATVAGDEIENSTVFAARGIGADPNHIMPSGAQGFDCLSWKILVC
jgi:hypothetical protein